MSSGRWLRELSPHQVIRNACCFPRSASITSHTKCMLLCPLGEHHLTCAQHRHCLPRTPAFFATPMPPPSPPPPSPPPSPAPSPPPSRTPQGPPVAAPAAIDTAVASTAMFAALASATIATSNVASNSLGRSRAPSCCCCFCAARLRRGGGGANCNARSPGTSLTSVSSLRR